MEKIRVPGIEKKFNSLEEAIDYLSKKIEKIKITNRNKQKAHKLKKIAALSKFSLIFSAAPILVTLGSYVTGNPPFKLKDKELHSLRTTIINEDGESVITETLNDDGKIENKTSLNYYTAWEESGKGNYSREIYIYDLKNDEDIQQILKQIQSSEEISQDLIESLLLGKTAEQSKSEIYKTMYKEKSNVEPSADNRDSIRFEKQEDIIGIREETSAEFYDRLSTYLFLLVLFSIGVPFCLWEFTYIFDTLSNDLRKSLVLEDTEYLEEQLNKLLYEIAGENPEQFYINLMSQETQQEPIILEEQNLQQESVKEEEQAKKKILKRGQF